MFGNATEMKRLTDIVWPIIIAAALEQIEKESIALSSSTTTSAEEAKTVGPIIAVMEAAVLLEAGWDTSVNEVWVTLVDEKTACARLMARNNLTEEVSPDDRDYYRRCGCLVLCSPSFFATEIVFLIDHYSLLFSSLSLLSSLGCDEAHQVADD